MVRDGTSDSRQGFGNLHVFEVGLDELVIQRTMLGLMFRLIPSV